MAYVKNIRKAFVGVLVLGLCQSTLAGIQTVYFCNLESGASMEKLMSLEKAYVAELKKLKGAESFTVKISTPIAAQAEQGNAFVWVGEVPDWKSYAEMTAAYEQSASAQKAGMAFAGVTRCKSSSIWQTTAID